jgi:hypothetical protein
MRVMRGYSEGGLQILGTPKRVCKLLLYKTCHAHKPRPITNIVNLCSNKSGAVVDVRISRNALHCS